MCSYCTVNHLLLLISVFGFLSTFWSKSFMHGWIHFLFTGVFLMSAFHQGFQIFLFIFASAFASFTNGLGAMLLRLPFAVASYSEDEVFNTGSITPVTTTLSECFSGLIHFLWKCLFVVLCPPFLFLAHPRPILINSRPTFLGYIYNLIEWYAIIFLKWDDVLCP